MSPGTIKFLLIVIAIIYFVSPIDALPDLLGPLGRIDDLLVLGALLWQSYRQGKSPVEPRNRDNHGPSAKPTQSAPSIRTPREIFGLTSTASKDEIEARFRELMKQYHPDRVAHLGDELKKLAHEKTLEIQRAYEALLAGKG
jgi:hypothetical protein